MKLRFHRHQHGSAVIVVLALLAILFAYLGFNAVTLQHLSREVKALDRRQIRRLEAHSPTQTTSPLTNAPEGHLPAAGGSPH